MMPALPGSSVVVEGDPRRGPLEDEERAVASVAAQRGLMVVTSNERGLMRVMANRPVLVAGCLTFIEAGLRAAGREMPVPDDYPSVLAPFFAREFATTTMSEVRRRVEAGEVPIFVKPALRRKRFRGLVLSDEGDLWQVASVGGNVSVVCCDVVDWLSEWRVFVRQGQVVGVAHYDGDMKVRPDRTTVDAIVMALQTAEPHRAAWAVDVGVLRSGRTAVVEVNDAFALGRYGLDPDNYFDFLLARWTQLIDSEASRPPHR